MPGVKGRSGGLRVGAGPKRQKIEIRLTDSMLENLEWLEANYSFFDEKMLQSLFAQLLLDQVEIYKKVASSGPDFV